MARQMIRVCRYVVVLLCGVFVTATQARADKLVDVIKQIKPSIVGVGIQDPLGAPMNQLQGTGFVIGDGHYVATNYHVISKPLSTDIKQKRIVFSGVGKTPRIIVAEVLAKDSLRDLAILKLEKRLQPLQLAGDELIDEGHQVAFTGFPIGAVLGLYPATHRGIIAAVSPDATPVFRADQLSNEALQRLKDPFLIYQLDATAYPGNSGSPLFNISSGQTIGIMNKVLVQKGRESALSAPTGISYAIPVKHLRALAKRHSIAI